MNDTERLLLDTLDELRQRLQGGTRYDLIKSAGLLRLLLLDEQPLMHQVNRTYRLKITFRAYDNSIPFPDIPVTFRWCAIDPIHMPNAPRVELKLDSFLDQGYVWWQENKYTVRDAILLTAHVKGGVHAGRAKSTSDELLLELDARAISFLEQTGRVELSMTPLREVIAVALDALKPLEDVIKIRFGLT